MKAKLVVAVLLLVFSGSLAGAELPVPEPTVAPLPTTFDQNEITVAPQAGQATEQAANQEILNKIKAIDKRLAYLYQKLKAPKVKKSRKRKNIIFKEIRAQKHTKAKLKQQLANSLTKEGVKSETSPSDIKKAITRLESKIEVLATKNEASGSTYHTLPFILGYKGGTLTLGSGFHWAAEKPYEMGLAFGGGIGNNYNVGYVSLLYRYVMNRYENPSANFDYAGMSLDAAYYSNAVEGILGLSNITEQGNRFGVGAFIGKTFGRVNLEFGYSTALGINASTAIKVTL